jgi:glycosyltransferase involved in cell wall biosynthesis
LKVIIVNYMETKDPGGINRVVLETASNLVKRGHETIVLQPNPSDLPDEEVYLGFKIMRISSPLDKYFYGLSIGIYNYLKKHIKDLNPDIIHIHGHHTLQSIQVIKNIKNIDPDIPIIFSPHLDVVTETFAGKYLLNIHNYFTKREIFKCSHIISVSQFESENIVKLLNVDPKKIKLIPHGVDVQLEKREKRDLCNDIVCIDPAKDINNGNKVNIVYAGHLVNRKGIDHIIKSLQALVYNLGVKNILLTIVGDGPEKEKLLKLSKELKIEDHIKWEPFLSRENFIEKIKNSDIFMLLSRSEAYGITVAEALALGTPCIITEKTALKEFSNEPGIFVVNYPPDPEEVAKIVLDVYGSEVTIGPFTEKIRSWKDVSEDYEKIYETHKKN